MKAGVTKPNILYSFVSELSSVVKPPTMGTAGLVVGLADSVAVFSSVCVDSVGVNSFGVEGVCFTGQPVVRANASARTKQIVKNFLSIFFSF
jgi:hypothetical protein